MIDIHKSYWFAVKTQKEFEAEKLLSEECDEVFLPKEKVELSSGVMRIRPIIPRLLFIRQTPVKVLEIEERGRSLTDRMVPLWVYRYEKGGNIQPITDEEIRLVKLLTASDTTKCEVYGKGDFKKGQHVRITGGSFAGYTGHVQRINKNKHVVVELTGLCAIALPFIHPDLLQPI